MKHFYSRLRGWGTALASRSLLGLLLATMFFLGWYIGTAPPAAEPAETPVASAAEVWTCSMHPQIRLPRPGDCPACGMDLVLADSGDESGEWRLTLTPAARDLLRVRTVPVERRFAEAEVRMVGKIDYDETRVANITARVGGRLDRLYVDFTGIRVQEGDHMVYLYSPEMYGAQAELLQALAAVRRLQAGAADNQGATAFGTLDAARERLRQWGLSQVQIAEIEDRGTPSDHLTINAPMGGVVVERLAQPGMYVDEGTHIYTLADLSQLWVKLDAFETDLAWLRYGQAIEFTPQAFPGEVFRGTIAFIDPVLDPHTRTVKVRVNVDNPDGRLKPEMFVRAVVRTNVAAGARVVDPDLAGKWICPMHPEVLDEAAGDCPECGMALVTTRELGYVPMNAMDLEAPLVIPASAALLTGRRAVVYVEVVSAEEPTYEGREVVLGQRAGSEYIVVSGLEEGERVVVDGNFQIDSALQIQARPSLMAPPMITDPEGSGGEGLAVDSAGASELVRFLPAMWGSYQALHQALSSDRYAEARASVQNMRHAFDDWADAHVGEPGEGTAEFVLESAFENLREASDLEALRRDFLDLHRGLSALMEAVDFQVDGEVVEYECPMVFGASGRWFQSDHEIRNPYHGESMLTCGDVIAEHTHAPGDEATSSAESEAEAGHDHGHGGGGE